MITATSSIHHMVTDFLKISRDSYLYLFLMGLQISLINTIVLVFDTTAFQLVVRDILIQNAKECKIIVD